MMNLVFRNPINLKEKESIVKLLSEENNMWYDDINLDTINILYDNILNEVIGCGRMFIHIDGSKELASIAVFNSFKKKGYGSIIIKSLLKGNTNIYNILENENKSFYLKYGFEDINENKLPDSIKSKLEKEKIRFPEDNSIVMIYKYNI